MATELKYKVRKMCRDDVAQVLTIERLCFKQPYSREILSQELEIAAAQLYVAVWRRKVYGYIDFWKVCDEIELVSIAVHPDVRRHGVGLGLMNTMLELAQHEQVRFIFLDVRAHNFPAQEFYKRLGFSKVGLRKRYYTDNDEDAIIMKKVLDHES